MSTTEQEPRKRRPRIGWPIIIAVVWSILVTIGCLVALIHFEYSGVDSTADFVVLVRNIALMGAAAIALPVSLYVLWMKDQGFKMDIGREIREQLDRDERLKRETIEEIRRTDKEMPILGNRRSGHYD